jgi:hypothetical protein
MQRSVFWLKRLSEPLWEQTSILPPNEGFIIGLT